MKKYKSISLIETLISLSVVGISIVALMPVMTVQKQSNDATKGNAKYWQTQEDAVGWYEKVSPAATINGINFQGISIGTDNLPQDVPVNNARAGRNFVVSVTGMASSDLSPLYAKELDYKGNMVLTGNAASNFIHLKAGSDSGNEYCSGAAKNLYVDANNVIIENITGAGFDTHLIGAANIPYNLCRQAGALRYDNSPNTAGDSISGIYSLKHGAQGEEYIHVDTGNNIVGIGHNAVKFSNPENISGSVIIASHSRIIPSNGSAFQNGLIIGYKNFNNGVKPSNAIDLTSENYVIYTLAGMDDILINANLFVGADAAHRGVLTANSVVAASDARLKDILGKYAKGLKYILQLDPVEYTYKSDENKNHHIGVIAQDLKKIFPESVFENKETGYLSINTDGIFYALLNSIKELNAKNQELKKQNDELEAKIAQLRKIRDDIKEQRGGQDE